MHTDHNKNIYNLPLRLILAFSDSGFEASFRDFYRNAYYRYGQIVAAFAVAVLFGNFLVDVLIFPSVDANFYQIEVCMPLMAAEVAISFTPYGRRRWQFLNALFNVAAVFSLVYVLLVTDSQGGMGLKSWISILYFVIAEFYCFSLSGLQFRYAIMTGVSNLLAFEAAMFLSFGDTVREFAFLSYYVLLLFLIAGFLGWWREFVLRRDFSARRALRAARQMAEDLASAKSDFLATMSHEIRTPMNTIIGMTHLALQSGLEAKQRGYIENVSRSAEHLLGLINQILDLSKMEAGNFSIESAAFNLEDVIANLANLIAIKAEGTVLDIMFDFSPELPGTLIGDAVRLGQVLLNLGSNAVKFTEQGEVVIGGAEASRTAHEVELHFWVKDSGIGMTAAQQARLFQSYSQGDPSTTRKYGGTGLGLAISKQLVELMGGRIWVESEFGKGSNVHFTARLGLPAQPMSRRQIHASEFAGKRVLIADDNGLARDNLAAMAQNFGAQADIARDGRQALAKIEMNDTCGQPYDIVLIDWGMPGMDGLECARQIKLAKFATPPAIIAVTTEASGKGKVEAAKQQYPMVKAVLFKPVYPSALLGALGEALGRPGIAASSRSQPAPGPEVAMRKLHGARLLLVEDNVLNQELANELLTRAGVTVVTANHGREALDILARDSSFDAILMDCEMPVLDGFGATREIRADPGLVDIPIIAVTANDMAGDRDRVLAAGMVDHVAKPFAVDKLFETIAKWVTPVHPPASAPVSALVQTSLVFELPGIDTNAGLRSTMNDETLYLNLLHKFHVYASNFAGEFRQARQRNDRAAATRAAHTLRGAAGVIGAKNVQKAASTLELVSGTGAASEVIEALLEATLTALHPVMQGLANLEWRATYPPATGGTGKNMLRPLLTRLIALLEDSNLEAGVVVDQLAACAKNTPLADIVQEAVEAVSAFDVDLALSILRKIDDIVEKD